MGRTIPLTRNWITPAAAARAPTTIASILIGAEAQRLVAERAARQPDSYWTAVEALAVATAGCAVDAEDPAQFIRDVARLAQSFAPHLSADRALPPG